MRQHVLRLRSARIDVPWSRRSTAPRAKRKQRPVGRGQAALTGGATIRRVNATELRACCLAQVGAFEDFPFGPEHSVFKVAGKMFALSALDRTPLEKLRISSVEPMDWSDRLIRLVAESPRIAKHAHVPMQSGSDQVLRTMHRKYRPWHYREKIERIRASMPAAAIGADVMVGFPGETDSDFEETRRMVEDLPFTYLHVFTYSSRPGTPAAAISGQVPVPIARERNRILRDLAERKKLEFMKSFIGRSLEAITLNVSDGKYTETLTDNYLKLRLAGEHEPNHRVEAQVLQVSDGSLVGCAAL